MKFAGRSANPATVIVPSTKDFVGRKPRTRAAVTREGRRALADHVAYLRDLIDGIDTEP